MLDTSWHTLSYPSLSMVIQLREHVSDLGHLYTNPQYSPKKIQTNPMRNSRVLDDAFLIRLGDTTAWTCSGQVSSEGTIFLFVIFVYFIVVDIDKVKTIKGFPKKQIMIFKPSRISLSVSWKNPTSKIKQGC